MSESPSAPPEPAAVCDGGDLDCGSGLLLIIRKAMDPLQAGEVLEIRSREASVREDLPAWCRMVAHEYVGAFDHPTHVSYLVRKGGAVPANAATGEAGGGLQEDLSKARSFTWAVRVRQAGEGQCRVYARSQSLTVGQPIDFGFGGGDAPLSAVEHLLGSLGACLLVGYQIHASRRGITTDQLELALRGKLDNPLVFLGIEEEGDAGLAEVSGTLYVSADAEEDVLQDLWTSTLARSPIAATLRPRVRLDLKCSVVW
jgi:TusA-related sulfurtransferase